jgi:serralysin
MDGGEGIDTLDVTFWAGAYNINLTTGVTNYAGETATNFENVNTGAGQNSITGTIGDNVINSGAGNDTVDGGDGNDRIDLGDGNDYLNITSLGNDTFSGGNGNDFIYGHVGNETYDGGAGNDTLKGSGGNDVLVGGIGNDALDGGIGNDVYIFDADIVLGTDIITELAVGGIDTLDFRSTTTKAITLNLDLVTNQLIATGVNLIMPSGQIEYAYGGYLNDNITGNSLNNYFIGGAGNDSIKGGAGDDTINGGLGNDSLSGGAGNDYLTGGVSNDTFYFNGAALTGANTVANVLGRDRITDFGVSTDKIALSKATFTKITSAVGGAIGSNFISVATDAIALTGTQSAAIVYSQQSGSLFYNQNGTTAGWGANGGSFAMVTSDILPTPPLLFVTPALLATNFVIVA